MADQLKGQREFDRMLSSLPGNMASNFLRGAAIVGAKVIRDRAKELVPVQHGDTRESISIGSSRLNGDNSVTVKIRTKGKGAYKAPWLEYGTAAHIIAIAESARPEVSTKRGTYRPSINALNRAAKRGTLIIGGKFVGESVQHPGARPHPFMRPAVDTSGAEAFAAAAAYVRRRFEKGGLKSTDPIREEAE